MYIFDETNLKLLQGRMQSQTKHTTDISSWLICFHSAQMSGGCMCTYVVGTEKENVCSNDMVEKMSRNVKIWYPCEYVV